MSDLTRLTCPACGNDDLTMLRLYLKMPFDLSRNSKGGVVAELGEGDAGFELEAVDDAETVECLECWHIGQLALFIA